MPYAAADGCRISYEIHGPAGAPALLFINSIGATRELWDRQRAALSGAYRVIQYDARGHGRSSVPPGDYRIEQLAKDALAILDAEGLDAAHVCGISLGGLTAMWLGVHAPQRVSTLTLANTGARIGTVESWTTRINLVRDKGMAGVADLAIPLWFTAAFRERDPEVVTRFRSTIETTPAEGYLGCCAALRDEDLREAIEAIACPVLAVAGASDAATAPALLDLVHERIPHSRLVTLDAAHLSNVEREREFTDALAGFLGAHP